MSLTVEECDEVRRLRRKSYGYRIVMDEVGAPASEATYRKHALGRCVCDGEEEPVELTRPGEHNTDPTVPALEDHE